jgi:hypothetical protein
MSDVKVGQLWEDNDKRRNGRLISVLSIDNNKARCEVLKFTPGVHIKKKFVSIRLDRFKPTSNGYKLVGGTINVTAALKNPSVDFISLNLDSATKKKNFADLCSDQFPGDWKYFKGSCYDAALLENDSVRIIVRDYGDGYDAKLFILHSLVFSNTYQRTASLLDVFIEIIDVGKDVANDLLDVMVKL